MKSKSIFAAAAGLGLVLLFTIVALRQPQLVRAQDDVGPPIHVRKERNTISSGMVGIAQGQTIRLNVVNTGEIGCPCQRVILNFRDAEGQLLRRSDGSIVEQSMNLEPGRAMFLDLNYNELPPGPTRLQLRAIVRFVPPGSDAESGGFERTRPVHNADDFVTTIEIFDNATGASEIVVQPPPLNN
jgi:hypothetical protein